MEGGTRPNTSGVTTPDPFDLNLEFDDASNGLSDYSSCEESEFERYCSANSVMGSASFCSSVGTCNDFFDSDFGSSRSLGGVEDGRAAWRIKNWTKSIPSSQVGLIGGGGLERQSSNVGAAYQLGGCSDTNGEGSGLLRDQRRRDVWLNEKHEFGSVVGENSEECLTRRSEFNSLLCKGVSVENVNEKGAGDSGCFDKFNGVVEEEETSVRGEYSDDDDDDEDGDGSILSYDTDDERRRNLHYRQEVKRQNENPLLINSSVAFGSDDWDEFIQESERTSLAFDRPQDERHRHLETEATGVSSAYVAPSDVPNLFRPGKEQTVRGVSVATSGVNHTEDFKMDMGSGLVSDSLVQEDLLAQETSLNTGSNIIDGSLERELKFVSNEEVIGQDKSDVSESVLLGTSQLQVDPLSNVSDSHLSYSTSEVPVGKKPLLSEGLESNVLSSTVEDNFDVHSKTISGYSPASLDQIEDQFSSIKVENLDSVESYDEVVLEMEEILLDSTESHGARFPQGSRASLTQQPQPFRDGSSTASTSGTDDPYPLSQHSSKVDWIEVIGAKQKKGDVSLGERIVGVKEYTVYVLRVRSGQDQWEVERRYRDFVTLYRQLKTLFADHGWTLPSPWSLVEQESRKIFGNASPNVVSQRSTLIQECLLSILRSGCPNGTQSILLWFLSPQKVGTSPSISNSLFPQSVSAFTGDVSTLGKTISLLVETQPRKSVKQLLEAQHYSCAGCHKRLDAEKTLMRELVQTLGWGKPRLCEYTGQLFCASCHTNDTVVLPARVLHFWDFTEYPVSQLAKSYLDSIYDQPMLCVSAVNPFLFSKVPPLLHVMGIRKKIGSMMPYVRCPFRRSIQRGVGSRRYLLESNEFFALRDLVDLSKGAFSALPVMVETVFKKVLEHITQQCLVCCDVGIPCGARHACEDPSSLIFPFQEDEIRRCSSCQLVFHEPCFRDISHCGCGANFKPRNSAETSNQVKGLSSNEYDVTLRASVEKPASGSSVGFISNLFSRAKQETIKRPKKSNPVILMGSLPSTFSDPLS